MRRYSGLMDRDTIRRAYSRSVMLGIQAGGHAVNIESPDLAVKYEAVSWQASAVSKALRAVLADLGIPAPATLAEVEACAGVDERMCGSDPVHIDRDLSVMRGLTADAIVDALGELAGDEGLLLLLADFPVTELLEETQWAA